MNGNDFVHLCTIAYVSSIDHHCRAMEHDGHHIPGAAMTLLCPCHKVLLAQSCSLACEERVCHEGNHWMVSRYVLKHLKTMQLIWLFHVVLLRSSEAQRHGLKKIFLRTGHISWELHGHHVRHIDGLGSIPPRICLLQGLDFGCGHPWHLGWTWQNGCSREEEEWISADYIGLEGRQFWTILKIDLDAC